MGEVPLTCASLLVRLRDPQDEAAWAQFVDLYTPLVYGYARKQGLQDADAADLCQEVLSAVAHAIAKFSYDPQQGAFRNWLFTIARRKLSNWRAAHDHRLLGSGDTAIQNLLEQCPVTDDMEAEWQADCVRRLFSWSCEQVRREVAVATWQAFWRTAVEDLPGNQVAAEVGLSVAAVFLARSRVFARLKVLIQFVQEGHENYHA